MTPLFMVCLPLIFLTLFPGIELNLFYSLVPVTGVALLLRALIMGNYAVALRYFVPVLVPTLVYAAVALRWAIDLFQREEVLFREAEHFNLYSWFRHLFRDREPLPTGGHAALCFRADPDFFVVLAAVPGAQGVRSRSYGGRRRPVRDRDTAGHDGTLAHVAAGPDAATRLASAALRLPGRWRWVLALNPIVNELKPVVEWLFPISSGIKVSLSQVLTQEPPTWRSPSPSSPLVPGDLRGNCISRLHTFGARTRAPYSFRDTALSLDVWFSSRSTFPVISSSSMRRSWGSCWGCSPCAAAASYPG